MPDHTQFFQQCLQIYLESNPPVIRTAPLPISVDDTFNKECTELYNEIQELRSFAQSVRPNYLLSNTTLKEFDDDDTGYDPDDLNSSSEAKPSVKFTEDDRDLFDVRSSSLLRKFTQKLSHIEAYESNRFKHVWFSHDLNEAPDGKKLAFVKSFVNFTLKKDEYRAVNEQVHKYREGVLNSLSLTLKKASHELGEMQQIRLDRKLEEKLNELHVLNNNDVLAASTNEVKLSILNDLNKNTSSYNQQLQIDESTTGEDENLQQYQETINLLAPQELQLLQEESSLLLENKLSELSKVKNLQKSTSEIANLQRELALHVESQAEQIKFLLDDQEGAQVDISKANKELNAAKRLGRNASTMVVYASVALGFSLLLFDWVCP